MTRRTPDGPTRRRDKRDRPYLVLAEAAISCIVVGSTANLLLRHPGPLRLLGVAMMVGFALVTVGGLVLLAVASYQRHYLTDPTPRQATGIATREWGATTLLAAGACPLFTAAGRWIAAGGFVLLLIGAGHAAANARTRQARRSASRDTR